MSQALHVAATLRLSDHLAAGPRSTDDLARLTGIDADSLGRLLHALSTIEVYRHDPDGRWENTELGAALCDDAPGSVGPWARQIGRPYYWQAWSGLAHSVRTGENAFTAAHGRSIWDYRRTRPDEQEIFDRAMTGLSAAAVRGVLDAYDFSPYRTVVDVGGGHGGLLAAVLGRHGEARGVLFDQPDVVAAARPLLAEAGVADRCDSAGGDFFASVPASCWRRGPLPTGTGRGDPTGRPGRRPDGSLPRPVSRRRRRRPTDMSTPDRSPALAALDALVGDWTVRPTPPPEWGVTDPDSLVGGVAFEWALGGAYLVAHSQAPDPVPDSMIVISPDGDGYLQHYYDSRGVTRLYRMTLAGGVWTLLRTEADFSPLDFAQRFVGEFGADGSTIDGRWEQSHDGGRTWELDFAITYRR